MNRHPSPAPRGMSVRGARARATTAVCASFSLAVGVLLLAACASAERSDVHSPPQRYGNYADTTSANASTPTDSAYRLDAATGAGPAGRLLGDAGDDQPQTAPSGPAGPDGQPIRRVVVYRAQLDLIADKTDTAATAVVALVNELDGYVQRQSADYLVVRVPAASFDSFFTRLREIGSVDNEQREALDVTEEFVDLQARLKSALAVQARLRGLLERADDVKAALAVEQELKRVDEDIERLKGQLAVLNNRIAFSTISIRLLPVARPRPVQVAEGFGELPFWWLRELNPNGLWR